MVHMWLIFNHITGIYSFFYILLDSHLQLHEHRQIHHFLLEFSSSDEIPDIVLKY